MKTPEQMAEEYINHVLESQCDCSYRIAFLAGYQAAMNFPEKPDSCEHILDMKQMVDVNSFSGWISVKERLPEDGEYVLIKCQDSEWYSIAFALREFWNKWNVTHWMPLPAAPKEEV